MAVFSPTLPDLYPHQEDAIQKVLMLDGRAGLFMQMRTGKSRVALAASERLNLQRLLVVAPLSPSIEVWKRELERWAPTIVVVDATQGGSPRRAKAITSINGSPRPTAVLVGYESYWREPLRSAILAWGPQMVIYDEAHRLAHRATKQSRFAHRLADSVPHRLGLTGTPMPNGIQDLFSIYKALDPTVFGARYADFEARYIVKGGYGGYQILGYRMEAEVERLLAEHSYRITRAETGLSLVAARDDDLPVVLSPKAREVYSRLKKHAISEVDGVQGQGVALSRIALTNVLRLQQVTSGFVKVDDGRIIDFSTEKVDALRDWLRDVLPEFRRVVVFCRFTHDVDAALETAQSVMGEGGHAYQMDGRVPKRDRYRLIEWFKVFEPAVLVANIKVASLSIDLSCAPAAVFYSPDYSFVSYSQCRDRLEEIGYGERREVAYYHLVATDSVDQKIYQSLANKEGISFRLLDKRRMREFFV